MSALPSLFVSHGSPMLALDPGDTGVVWRAMAASLERPSAMLVISAHWMTGIPVLSTARSPATIHDFYGFPEPLYQLYYEPPGEPCLAEQIAARLSTANVRVGIDPSRGLDHGAWIPLRSMYPAADIPAFQLSIQPRNDPAYHYRLGQALAGLGEEGVLVLASGGMTHNLRDLVLDSPDGKGTHAYVHEFSNWMHDKMVAHDIDALLDYRRQAPHAQRAHPTDEHLLPLFVALGVAGETASAARFYTNVTLGCLSMDAYCFQ